VISAGIREPPARGCWHLQFSTALDLGYHP